MIYSSELIQELEYLKKDMEINNQDLVISVWGLEGSGKSIFTINLGKVLDPSYNAGTLKKRVARSVQDFARKATKIGPYQVAHWDEAHRLAKRGTYDDPVNRDLMEYFMDIRGAKRIFILCYPSLKEMDRYITEHRTRLFFETVKKGHNYWIHGWRKDQVMAKLDTQRLYNARSKKERWKGIPKHPILTFKCDFKDIEAEKQEYEKIKEASLKAADDTLMAKYGYYNLMDLIREVQQVTNYNERHIRTIASKAVRAAAEGGWKDHIIIKNNRYTIMDEGVFENLKMDILNMLPRARIPENAEASTNIHGGYMNV